MCETPGTDVVREMVEGVDDRLKPRILHVVGVEEVPGACRLLKDANDAPP